MMFGSANIFFIALCVLVTVHYTTSAYVNVTTPFGVIEGIQRDVTTPDGLLYQVGVFLGIPYAKPPVGSLRFQKPVYKSSPGPFFKAHIESKACPQSVVMLKGWVPGPSDMSEDCLKLNVYVPLSSSSCLKGDNSMFQRDNHDLNNNCSKKAVMVWIHGGAFIIGQSRIYDAQRLASVGDIIVVTINYRLGSLGFLSTGDGVVRGNAGLWDQYGAVDWVKKNIESFGGDSTKITVSGESAGGASSIYQLLHPGNKGKITRVAVSSGTPLCPWAFSEETTAKYANRLAKRVGCAYDYLPGFSAERHMKMVRCLQSKPFQDIINNSSVGSFPETLFRAEWVPTIDGEFLKAMPRNILKWPRRVGNTTSSILYPDASLSQSSAAVDVIADVDAMVGSNYDDGEVVAKITVRNLINAIAGLDFNDEKISPEIIEKFYFPQIILDHFGRIKPELHSVFKDAYRKSLNNSGEFKDGLSTPRLRALQEILESTTDYEFLMPAVQTVASMANLKRQVSTSSASSKHHFLYQFNRKYPNLSRPEWNRNAAHGDDLPYIFGFPSSMIMAFNITREVEQQEWNTSKMVMTYWANFVKTGNPNTPEAVPSFWPQFKESDVNYLLMSQNMSNASSRTNMFPVRVSLWRDIMNPV